MRIGVTGAASIFTRKWLPLFEKDERVKLVGVGRRKIDENEDRFSQRSGYYCFDKDEIDMVYIPLPNNMHYDISKYYLKKEINVLVEKPCTLSLSKTRELTEIANEKKVFIKESFQWGSHMRTKKLIEICNTHEVYLVDIIFTMPHLSESDIRYKKELDGGAIADLGSYICSVLSILFPNENFELQSDFYKWNGNKQVDIGGTGFFLNAEKSKKINFYYAFGKSYESRITIHTQNGRFDVNQPFTHGNQMPAVINHEFNTIIKQEKFLDCHFESLLNELISNPIPFSINHETMLQAELLNQLNK